MRGLIGVAYFMLCGYLFAKYDGDKLVIEAARKILRAAVAEAEAVRRELAPAPAVVVDLTSADPYRIDPQALAAIQEWWEARPHG